VLDEADEMLDMGFAEDLDAILSKLPEGHQTALFSATLPAAHPGDREVAPEEPAQDRDRARAHRARRRAARRRRRTSCSARTSRSGSAACSTWSPDLRDRLLPHARRSRRTHRGMNAHGYRAEALHGGFLQDPSATA
jgi:ATP-dependent RNA helicase DeaD